MSTLEQSQSIFEEECTSKIWEMMDNEFMKACSSILEVESLHNPYMTTVQTASIFRKWTPHFLDNLPLSTKKLVTPPITTSMKSQFNETDIMHRLLEGRWCEQDLYLRVCSADSVWGFEPETRFLCFSEAHDCIKRFQARCMCNVIILILVLDDRRIVCLENVGFAA